MNFSAKRRELSKITKQMLALVAAAFLAIAAPGSTAIAAESTMPPSYVEQIKPEVAQMYVYSENTDFASASELPTYQWMPASGHIKAIILGIHGLTLHGRRYRVLARTMAINDIAFIAPDMRGFGANKFEVDGKEKPKSELSKINHELSYQDLAKLAAAIKAKYPHTPLIAMGESLGCTFCVRLAGEHPDIINGVVLSAPAVRVNPKMYASAHDIEAGLKALVGNHHLVNLNNFFTDLVSPRPEIVKEMKEDPFIVKALSFHDLISTDFFVDKTVDWSKTTSTNLPMLVIQGSNDSCVLPKHLTDLMMHMKSNDMRISWKGTYGHLQLETMFMRANIIDTVAVWLQDHSVDNRVRLEKLERSIADVGGTLVH